MKKNELKQICAFTCCGIGDFIWATSAIFLIKNYNRNINLTLITFDSYKSIIDDKLKVDNILFTSYKYFFHSNKLIRYLYKFCWLIKLYFFLHSSKAQFSQKSAQQVGFFIPRAREVFPKQFFQFPEVFFPNQFQRFFSVLIERSAADQGRIFHCCRIQRQTHRIFLSELSPHQ